MSPPKPVRPVPPLAAAIVVPFQVPLVIVPSVVRLVEPAQVERAVFSTLFKSMEALRLVVVVLVIAPVPFPTKTWPTPRVVAPVPPLATVSWFNKARVLMVAVPETFNVPTDDEAAVVVAKVLVPVTARVPVAVRLPPM